MARRRLIRSLALAIAAAAAFALWCGGCARAQNLPRLSVTSLDLSADNDRPALEVPFHLIVRAHVRERVTSIDTVTLPILAELELRGDERSLQSGPAGTDYREIITVVAHHTGRIDIAPVTLQAVDARDGHPKQYFSNALTLYVGGGSLQPLRSAEHAGFALLHFFGDAALWIGGIACAVAIVALVFQRRPQPVPVPAAAVAAPPPARPRTRRDEFQDALTVLRAERSRTAAVRVRAAVWRSIGASEGETLADVLSRPEAEDPRMNDLLRSLERAAFTYDADVQAGIVGACDALERYLA